MADAFDLSMGAGSDDPNDQPAEPAAPAAPRVERRAGRPKGSKNKRPSPVDATPPPPGVGHAPVHAVPPGVAAVPATPAPAAMTAAAPEVEKVAQEAVPVSLDVQSVWTQVVNAYKEAGRSLEDVEVRVYCIKRNGLPTSGEHPLEPRLLGSQIQGTDAKTPGEELYDIILNHMHHSSGPAEYQVKIFSRHKGQIIRVPKPLQLDSWERLMESKRRFDQEQQAKLEARKPVGYPYGGGGYGYGAPPMGHGYPPPPYGAAGYPYPYGPQPQQQPVAAPQVGLSNGEREAAYLRGVVDQLLTHQAAMKEAAAMGRPLPDMPPPPPPPPPVAAAPAQPPEDPMDKMMRDFQRMQQMRALFAPEAPAMTPELVGRIVAQQVVQLQEAGVLAKPGAAAAAVAAAAVAPPVDPLEQMIAQEKAKLGFERKFRILFPDYVHKDEVEARQNVTGPGAGTAEEPEQEAVHMLGVAVPGVEPLRWTTYPKEGGIAAWAAWLVKLAALNPNKAGQVASGAIEAVSRVAPHALGDLFQAMKGMGGVNAAAALAQEAANGAPGGWTSPS